MAEFDTTTLTGRGLGLAVESAPPTTPPEHTTDEQGDYDLDVADLDDVESYPLIPWCDSTDAEFGARWVDYSDRGPRDVVVSGPITGGWGPGRWHRNRRVAYWRLVELYGADRVKQLRQSQGRWSFLIKNLRA